MAKKLLGYNQRSRNLTQNQIVNLSVMLEEVRGLRQILSQSMKKICGDGGEVFQSGKTSTAWLTILKASCLACLKIKAQDRKRKILRFYSFACLFIVLPEVECNLGHITVSLAEKIDQVWPEAINLSFRRPKCPLLRVGWKRWRGQVIYELSLDCSGRTFPPMTVLKPHICVILCCKYIDFI